MTVDPLAPFDTDAFLATWIRGWAASRELAAPVPEGSGWRVEVGWPAQRRRHVFPEVGDEIAALGASIHEPWVYLKACGTAEAMRARLPARWEVGPPSFVMTVDALPEATPPLPPGYALDVRPGGGATWVRVLAEDGALAADGRVALVDGQAIVDRIGTDAAHRRRGLGRALMGALHAQARARGAARGLLVATVAGRALYETLGWRVRAPYASAVIAPAP